MHWLSHGLWKYLYGAATPKWLKMGLSCIPVFLGHNLASHYLYSMTLLIIKTTLSRKLVSIWRLPPSLQFFLCPAFQCSLWWTSLPGGQCGLGTLIYTCHYLQYLAYCTVPGTMYSTWHIVQYLAQCTVPGAMYSNLRMVQYLAHCTVPGTMYST